MEDLLQRAGSQAVTFAIRSGISIASGYAIKTLTKFMDKLPEGERSNLLFNRTRLQTKITIITPAIDLIELISARGNTSLGSTLELTQELKRDIDEFEQKVDKINDSMVLAKDKESKNAVKEVDDYIRDLLFRIEESIPLISLALTTSGANLSARLPDTVSPGRLLQAANYLTSADESFQSLTSLSSGQKVQIGPSFTLKLYTIFYGTARNPNAALSGDVTWKEEHAKCSVRLWRVYHGEFFYEYEMTIDEDLDDERYHEKDEKARSRVIDISEITRLFFSASGRLLEIEEAKTPVLVLKLNSTLDREDGRIEWLAFEEFGESGEEDDDEDDSSSTESGEESDDDNNEDDSQQNEECAYTGPDEGWSEELGSEPRRRSDGLDYKTHDCESSEEEQDSFSPDKLISKFNQLSLDQPESTASLSLLEYIIRLAALQANDQQSMYTTKDERISLYLRDEAAAPTSSSVAATASSSTISASNPATPTSIKHYNMSQRKSSESPKSINGSGSKKLSASRARSRRTGRAASPAALDTSRLYGSQGSVGSPRTPSKPGAEETSSTSPVLTPWEQDRLKHNNLRRNLLDQYESPSKRV